MKNKSDQDQTKIKRKQFWTFKVFLHSPKIGLGLWFLQVRWQVREVLHPFACFFFVWSTYAYVFCCFLALPWRALFLVFSASLYS